jgi:hypothetical protein
MKGFEPDFEGQRRRRFGLQLVAAFLQAAAAQACRAARALARTGLGPLLWARGEAARPACQGGGAMATWPGSDGPPARAAAGGAGWVGPQARPNPIDRFFLFFELIFNAKTNSRKV